MKARALLGVALLSSLGAVALDQWTLLFFSLALALQLVYAHVIFRPEGQLAGTRGLDIDRIREGDDVRVVAAATNTGSSTTFIELRDRLPRQLRATSGRTSTVAALRPGEHRALDVTVRAPLMGVYDVGPLEARLEDPYALYFEERRILEPNQLIVMPAEGDVDEVEPIVRIFQSFQGEYQVNQPGDGFDFFGMRDYVSGDVYRAINWKASARVGKLIVNQFERTTSSQITFFVDGRAIANVGREDRTPFVGSCRATAALLRDFFGRRDTPRLVIYGKGLHIIHPGPPERMITESLETLAMWRPDGDEPFSHAVSQVLPGMVPGSPAVLFSSLVDDPTVLETVAMLLSNDFLVLVVSPAVDALPGTSAEEEQALRAGRERIIDGLRGFDIDVIEPVHLEATPDDGAQPGPRGAAVARQPKGVAT